MADVYGSRAYLPLDFITNGCKYSVSTDVFSFGVVSFDLTVYMVYMQQF